MYLVREYNTNKILASFDTETDAKDYALMFDNIYVDDIPSDIPHYPSNSATLQYMGRTITVPPFIKYLTTDKSGSIYAYPEKPEMIDNREWYLEANIYVGNAKSESFDWKKSLVEVNSLLDLSD